MLKVFVCSDLHVDFMTEEERVSFTLPDADVYLIAGDTMNGVKKPLCEWVITKTTDKPTFLIPGNHEYYGLRRDKAFRKLNEYFKATNVTVLLDSYSEITPGLAVYGTDYWTDMDLHGDVSEARRLGKSKMNDYHSITFKNQNSFRKLSPANTIEWHHNAKKKLSDFSERYIGQYILMTHHGVFKDCLPLREDGTRGRDELDPLYSSDGEKFINSLSNKPILCVNGHMHHFNKFENEGIPVLSNPRGYKGTVSNNTLLIEHDGNYKISPLSFNEFRANQVEKAYVYMWDNLAGKLYRNNEDIFFQYDILYIENNGIPICLSLPLKHKPYVEPIFFRIILDEDDLNFQGKVTGYPSSDYLSILAAGDIDFPGSVDVRVE